MLGGVRSAAIDVGEARSDSAKHRQLRHPNIVQFLGACLGDELLIVTEYMPRGSLDAVLKAHGAADSAFFTVGSTNPRATAIADTRKVEFAKGIARGLYYLHSRDPPIVHRDVKSLNILVRACSVRPVDGLFEAEVVAQDGNGRPVCCAGGDGGDGESSRRHVQIGEDWKAVVADFGLTKFRKQSVLRSFVGSPAWAAPEGACVRGCCRCAPPR